MVFENLFKSMTQRSSSSDASQGPGKKSARPSIDFGDFSPAISKPVEGVPMEPAVEPAVDDAASNEQAEALSQTSQVNASQTGLINKTSMAAAPESFDMPKESSRTVTSASSAAQKRPLSTPKQDPEEQRVMELKTRYLSHVLKKADAALFQPEKKSQFAEEVADLVDAKLAEESEVASDEFFTKLVTAIVLELSGYGPLQQFLDDPSVIEIMVNGPGRIYVEQEGKIVRTSASFTNQASVRRLMDHILTPIGRHVDDTAPICDARLPDGSRVNIVITPCAVDGPNITIRKYPPKRFTMERLIESKTISKGMAMFLQAAMRGRLNIVIAGATGSGKTTLLNALSAYIPNQERVVTIEDSAELQLDQEHVVRLETRPPDLEGRGAVTIRDLVRTSLRMRPDRVIVGECRGAEALDMIQAMNTGHAGSLTTIHANSPRDAVARLSTLILTAGIDLPEKAVRDQIVGSIDLFVQMTRLPDGSRRVTYITEITGIEGNHISLQDLFRFEQTGISANGKVYGKLKGCGILPHCVEKMRSHGETLSIDFFQDAIDVP